MRKNQIFKFLVLTLLMSVIWFCAEAKELIDADVERFYNLPISKQQETIKEFKRNSKVDSALFYSNILVNKLLDKRELTDEESDACCAELNFMGMVYMMNYYNYQLGARYFLKAKQLAEKYGQKWQYMHAVDHMAILNATKNNIEKNFAYSSDLLGYFKDSFRALCDYRSATSYPASYEDVVMDDCMENMIYVAIKYDKVGEIVDELKAYRSVNKPSSYPDTFCKMAELWQDDRFDEAFACSAPDSIDFHLINANDSIVCRVTLELARYYLLTKANRMDDAEKHLLRLEEECRKRTMAFGLIEVQNMLQLHYERKGDYESAQKYELAYFTTKDEFISKSMLGKVDAAELNLKLEEVNEQMSEMNYRHKLQTVVLIGVMIFAMLAVCLLAVVFAKNRKIRKTNEVLYKKNVELLHVGTTKQLTSSIPRISQDETAQIELLEKIDDVMRSSDEIFRENFSVNRLAELVGSNRTYVSQVINDKRECNFPSLLNEYRIKEACRRLLDTVNYGSYTIESIARSVGYKSRTNFATVFKEITGLTPSAFQKMSRPLEEISNKKD